MDENMRSRAAGRYALLVVTLLLVMAGCNRSNREDIVTEQRLRALATAYLDFAVAKGRGPINPAELQQSLRSLAQFKVPFEVRGILADSVLLTSARDEQPFVIRYGEAITLTSSSTGPAIAYEAAGDVSSRYVAYANGDVKLVSDENLKKSLPSDTP